MPTDERGGAEIHLRPAEPGDMRRLFEWANDPDTRATSFNSAPIPWDDHVRWYNETLSIEERQLYIGEADARPVSMIRFDRRRGAPTTAIVNINVSPESRGKGFGKSTLRAATHVAAQLGIMRLFAEIRPTNAASVRTFESTGYKPCDENDRIRPIDIALCYTLSVHAESHDRIE